MNAFRRRLRRTITASLSCALSASLLVSCVNPVIEEPEPYPQLNAEAGPPLPPDSRIELPGEIAPQEPATGEWEGSLRPDDKTPEERVPDIFERGRIIVGVDQSQNLLSFRDPVSGQLKGFEVQLAKEVARDIFGDPEAVDFRFVDSGDRLRALEQGTVDIVIRSMSLTQDRARRAEFSTPYFRAQTRLLVMDSSGIEGVADLAGHTVCVTEGSTALDKARAVAPQSKILRTRNWSDCLMALQQQQAQAILGDDAILSGIAAQDPYTRILPVTLDMESYSVAVARTLNGRDTSGLVRQVNSTMERIRMDTTWWSMFNDWFGPYLYTYGPPPLQYRDEPAAEEEDGEETDGGQ